MARTRFNLHENLRQIVHHTDTLPPEGSVPHTHFKRSIGDLWNLLLYIDHAFEQATLKQAARDRHMTRLHAMVLVNFVETFERYLKEVASRCVDFLAHYVLDDRFNAFRIQGSALAAHFGTDSLGRSLCESMTWLDCDEVNDRLRRLLASPFENGTFFLFPKQPQIERERYDTLSLVWQLRHTIVHNVGVITQSDAIKFRLLVRSPVPSMQVLSPTRNDLRYLKRFLEETAARSNQRIGDRLAELLTSIHANDPTLFVPQEMADSLTRAFGASLTVGGAVGVLAP